jgi:glycogen operon protein
MLSVVINPFFDWGSDRHPEREYHDTIIYEAHVKGLTMTHPGVPEEIRGTYAGIAHPATIAHLKELGVTAIELMPVHQFVQDTTLVEKGLANYWGYNTIGFFAPHNSYSATGQRGQQVQEFKAMVKALHEAEIEVILDVVYNHTAEGNHLGPTICFRGIDNAAYYRLVDNDKQHYYDTTGTGNTLLMRHPHVLQLIMDSLRYWVTEMHVDGFRFDLASSLARQFHEVDRLSAFFDLVQQDPVVSQVKLIAEPWDVGDGGYQVGNFPPLWTEWNGKYRDTVRDYWRGEPGTLGDFASRLSGSSDLYEHSGRKPIASINFVTAHDGFTMRDLVSYNEKHNEANGEGNNDGESHNRSWNCGAEGPTDDPKVQELRARQQRNFLVTLLLSQGVPMMLHGDELGRSQRGNNNVYAQDNELSWMDWDLAGWQEELLAFTRRVVALRNDHPVFRRRRFFAGARTRDGGAAADIVWFTPDGKHKDDWGNADDKALMVFVNGDAIPEPGRRGERVSDDSFLIAFNASDQTLKFTIPGDVYGEGWVVSLDTNDDAAGIVTLFDEAVPLLPGLQFEVTDRSVVVLRRPR